jgi:hypothetical protein
MPSFVAGIPFSYTMLWSPPSWGWIRKSFSVFIEKGTNIFRNVLTLNSSVDVTVKPISGVPVNLLIISASATVAVVWKMESSALGGGDAHGV